LSLERVFSHASAFSSNRARRRFWIGSTSLGATLIALGENGVRAVEFGEDENLLLLLHEHRFSNAARVGLAEDGKIGRVVEAVEGRGHLKDGELILEGTQFQASVWRGLRQTKAGERLTYGELAARLRRPLAVRGAVAGAVAGNELGVIVPCHRVLAASGRSEIIGGAPGTRSRCWSVRPGRRPRRSRSPISAPRPAPSVLAIAQMALMASPDTCPGRVPDTRG
jgi:AraC family transcriptional regulator of adaptative response/methylated-DNA-[protein]-cysteine methyltransferase